MLLLPLLQLWMLFFVMKLSINFTTRFWRVSHNVRKINRSNMLWNCIAFWNTWHFIPKKLLVLFIYFYKYFKNIFSFENDHQYIFSLAGDGVSKSILHLQLVTSSWLTVASKGCLWMQQSNSFSWETAFPLQGPASADFLINLISCFKITVLNRYIRRHQTSSSKKTCYVWISLTSCEMLWMWFR